MAASRIFRDNARKCVANQMEYAALNAFITPLPASGSWEDRARDGGTRSNRPKSGLDGKLVAIKDNICTRDFPTTCASDILDGFTSPFNATVVETLEDRGVVVAGKTNLDEFGMGSHSTHSRYGAVKNSVNNKLTAGGSSGGSAVAVATGQCDAALGTDTGGSVRIPAAYTGTVGFKPSYGRISRWGVVAYANSLDTVGLLGPDTNVIRKLFDILNYPDFRDPTSLSAVRRFLTIQMIRRYDKVRRKLRIGVPKEYNVKELTPVVREVWERSLGRLKSQGHTIHPVSLPTTKQALSAYYVLAPAEASSNLAKYDGVRYGKRDANSPDNADGYLYAQTRGDGFGEEAKRRILLGTFSLSADAINNYFTQAQRLRRLVQEDFNSAFRFPNPLLQSSDQLVQQSNEPSGKETIVEIPPPSDEDPGVDVLVCPTTSSLPPTLESLEGASPVQAYTSDVFTVPASLAGLPALNVPVALPEAEVLSNYKSSTLYGVQTLGMQVIGQYGDDDVVLDVGELLEMMD